MSDPAGGRMAAEAAAVRVARTSYGRLVAAAAAGAGDVAGAEDALADAFERALRTWPRAGVPDSPEGWLLTVARNRLKDVRKSAAYRRGSPLDPLDIDTAGGAVTTVDTRDVDPDAIPDRRLELMFVCAHPAIDTAARAPLMLQVVLGFEAVDLAGLYAVSPEAMAQRLVRAKRRIRQLRIPFVVPDQSSMPQRLSAALDAIYGCYTLAAASDDPAVRSLVAEADYLASMLTRMLGREPEAWGLHALISLARSRERPIGAPYAPLDDQDPAGWKVEYIARGDTALRRAAEIATTPGRFQLEAAIQSVHAERRTTGRVDRDALITLHRALLRVAPTVGASVSLAGVLLRTDGSDAALDILDRTARPDSTYQPWHAVRAEALARAGRYAEAREAFTTAIDLAGDTPEARYLVERRGRLGLG